jgi:signal transduction histidine kinase
MSVRFKLIVILSFVALAPLLVSALMALRVHQRAYERVIAELEDKAAEAGARHAWDYVDHAARGFKLTAAGTVRWRDLSDEERTGALWLVYRQQADLAWAALVEDGHTVGPAVYRSPATPELDAHPLLPAALAEELLRRAPPGGEDDVRIGTALSSELGPILPMSVAVDGAGPRWTVAVGLSLAALCADLRPASGATEIVLSDGTRDVCAGAPLDEPLRAAVAAGQQRASYRDRAGGSLEAAIAPMPRGWSVIARQSTEVAFAASRTLRRQTIFWIALCLVIALVAGALLAQSITRPAAALAHGSAEVAQGNFAFRLADDAGDELGRAAQAFNRMCVEIEKRDAEIRAWNQELQARVEERTRELHEAQAQLLQSQKIAAVSSLGAGMAHEINNPLTSVLGFTQVLLARAREAKDAPRVTILETIEHEAQRIRDVVQVLLGFSESYAGEYVTELDAGRLLDDTMQLLGESLGAGHIEVVRAYQPSLPLLAGNRAQLQEALAQIIKNAITAMRGRGRLTLSTAAVNGGAAGQAVKIAVADDGEGIAPEHLSKIFDPFFTTKADPRGEGLGLTVAHRIVEGHHGTVKVASTPGQGATFTITLPAARRGSHLV